MSLLYKEPVKRAEKALKEFNDSINIIELESSARTAIDAANSLKCEVGAIVKSLLLRTENDFILCLISGDKRCSLNKIKKILNQKDVSMANAEEVKENTGFTIGGVSPTGHLKRLNIIVDKSLSRFEYIYAAAGHPDCVFKITYSELIKLTNGKEKEVIE